MTTPPFGPDEPYPLSPEAKDFIETADILAEPYREKIAKLTAERDALLADLAAARAEVERLRGLLAVVELVETTTSDCEQCDGLRQRADQAEAAIEAAMSLLDEYDARGDFKWGVKHLRAALAGSSQRDGEHRAAGDPMTGPTFCAVCREPWADVDGREGCSTARVSQRDEEDERVRVYRERSVGAAVVRGGEAPDETRPTATPSDFPEPPPGKHWGHPADGKHPIGEPHRFSCGHWKLYDDERPGPRRAADEGER